MYNYLPYRIPFSETDAMAIVHHSNHAKYFERGRINFLSDIGISYAELSKQNNHFPVLELSIKFQKPILFDELILIQTSINQTTKTRLAFDYKLYQCPVDFKESFTKTEQTLGTAFATAQTLHCCLSSEGKPQKIKTEIYEKLKQYEVI